MKKILTTTIIMVFCFSLVYSNDAGNDNNLEPTLPMEVYVKSVLVESGWSGIYCQIGSPYVIIETSNGYTFLYYGDEYRLKTLTAMAMQAMATDMRLRVEHTWVVQDKCPTYPVNLHYLARCKLIK